MNNQQTTNGGGNITPLNYALAYARQGWPVVSLHSVTPDGKCTCGKPDCGQHAGKHPRIKKWRETASTDAEQIRKWWKDWPTANIGIVTGHASGVFVVDIDPRHGGDKELAKLFAAHGEFPKTLQVQTGGDGAHYYFRMPGFQVKNMTGKSALKPGLEIKSDGGLVVAPPSNHLSGKRYVSSR